MKLAFFFGLSLFFCLSCGEIRTTKVAPDPVPKISLEVQSWPYKQHQHFKETMDDVQLTASFNTEEKGLERYLLSVRWTQPETFPLFTWTIYYRYGNRLKQYAWTAGNGNAALPLPLVMELKQPLPDAIEFRLWVTTDFRICDLHPQSCPLVKSILIRQ